MSRSLDPDESGPSKNINFRLPQSYIDALEQEAERRKKEDPDLTVNVSLVLRGLIRRALLEQDGENSVPKGACVACGQCPPTRRSLRGRLLRAERARAKDPNGARGITRPEILKQLGGSELGIAKAVQGTGPTTPYGRRIANLLMKRGY
jgi:hypothetical protein